MHKPALDQGNSCFIDPETLMTFSDQWNFLSGIEKAGIELLDEIYHSISGANHNQTSAIELGDNNNLTISLSNALRMNRSAIPLSLINFLREELNFSNSEFIIKKKAGRNTFGTERYFRFVEETDKEVILPRSFAGKLLRFCKDTGIAYTFNDQRQKTTSSLFKFQAALRSHQIPAFEATNRKEMGVIVAPPVSASPIQK